MLQLKKLCKVLRGDSKGVSAVEVIIALAILGIVAVAFLTGLSTALKATSIADERSVAQSLAQSQTEYVKSQDYADNADNNWSYTVTTSGSSSLDAPSPWFDASHALSNTYAGYCVKVQAEGFDANGDGNIDADDEGIRKITVTVYHNEDCAEDEVLTLEGYKVDR